MSPTAISPQEPSRSTTDARHRAASRSESASMSYEDLVGRRYGRLTVLSQTKSKKQRRRWECACACGNTTNVPTTALQSGNTRSCGCLFRDVARERARLLSEANVRHGMTSTPTWSSWRGVVVRFLVPATPDERIEIDSRWVESYESFLGDMGEKEPGQQLVRIDPSGPFAKANCRWSP